MLDPEDFIEPIEPWTPEEIEIAEGDLDTLWGMLDRVYDEYIADEKTAERRRQMHTITFHSWRNRVLTQVEKLQPNQEK